MPAFFHWNRRNVQRLELQRGWAEEKGGLRRAAEDALRRVVDAKGRVEEEAALKVRARQTSRTPLPRDATGRLVEVFEEPGSLQHNPAVGMLVTSFVVSAIWRGGP